MQQPEEMHQRVLATAPPATDRSQRFRSIPWRRESGLSRKSPKHTPVRADEPHQASWKAWLLASERRPTLCFLASLSLLFAVALVRYPGSLLSNIPWAEEGTNLFYKAYYESLWNNLWGTDTGYLTSLPRFFAVILVKVFGVHQHFFLAIHLIGAALVAFMAAVFALAPFRTMVRSDEARLVLSLCCGSEVLFGIGPYNLCFFNIAYCGAAFPLLMLCLDHERLGRKAFYFLAAFTALLLTSKAYFITFLPLYGLVMVYGVVAKRRQTALFAAIGTTATIIQLCVMVANRGLAATANTGVFADYGRRAFLRDNLFSFLSTYLEVFLNRRLLPTDPACTWALYGIVTVLVACLAWALWKRSKPMFWFFVGANAVAVAALTISLLCVRWDFAEVDRHISGDRLATLLPSRHYAFSSILITFATLVCLVRLARGRRSQVATALMLYLVVYNAGFFYTRQGDNLKLIKYKYSSDPAAHQWSQWDTCWHLVDEADCFIPIKPYPWVIQRGNDYLNPDPMEAAEQQRVTEVSFNDQQRTSWRLRGLIVVKMLPSAPADAPLDSKPVRAVAYDAQNNRLAEAQMLSPPGCDYIYLLFPRKLEQVARLTFVDETGQSRPVISRIRYFGSEMPLPGAGALASKH